MKDHQCFIFSFQFVVVFCSVKRHLGKEERKEGKERRKGKKERKGGKERRKGKEKRGKDVIYSHLIILCTMVLYLYMLRDGDLLNSVLLSSRPPRL